MVQLPSKIIVGVQPYIDRATKEWAIVTPELELKPVPLMQDASYNFNFSSLTAYDPKSVTAFVAMSDQFLNRKRHELFVYLKKAGFSLPPLVHPQSLISANAAHDENVGIGQGVLVGNNVVVGMNTYIGAGSAIHNGSHVGENVTIRENVKIAADCKIGPFVTLGANIILQPGTEIDEYSRITKPGTYQGHYRSGTFIEDRFEAVILG